MFIYILYTVCMYLFIFSFHFNFVLYSLVVININKRQRILKREFYRRMPNTISCQPGHKLREKEIELTIPSDNALAE